MSLLFFVLGILVGGLGILWFLQKRRKNSQTIDEKTEVPAETSGEVEREPVVFNGLKHDGGQWV